MFRISLAKSSLCAAIAITSLLTGTTHAADAPKTVRIIYSNDTKGYLEPCSCGGRYQGGLSRRATLISRLVKENPDAVIVESGNLSDKPNVLGMVAKLLAAMKYDAVGVGAFDLAGGEELFDQAGKSGLKVIDTQRPESKTVAPYIVKEISGMRVGIVSYGVDCIKDSSRRAFYTALKSARDTSDVLILLDQGGIATRDWLNTTASTVGVPDIVVGGLTNINIIQEQIIGRAHVVPVWLEGTKVGVVDVEMGSDHSLKMTTQALNIDKDVPEDEIVKKQIQDYIDRPKKLASLSPSILNLGNIKRGTKREDYVTLVPNVAEHFTISKAYSSGKQVSVPDWKPAADGCGYRIKIVVDAGNASCRFLETVSIELDLPDHPTLNLRVFGNIVDEE